MAVIFIGLTGCSKDISLTEEDTKNNKTVVKEGIENNTILVREDGTLQVAIVDLFDKEYYNIEEFEGFVNEEINNYNADFDDSPIVFNALEKRDDSLVIVMTYNNMEHYSAFNNIEGLLLDAPTARQDKSNLPESFSKNGGNEVEFDEALEKDEYKIFGINEQVDIIVDGKILYYSNGEYIDSQTMKSDEKEITYIIFKDKMF